MGGYQRFGPQNWIRKQVREALNRAKDKYPDVEIIGGLALGFDLWAMDEAIRLSIPVLAYQPIPNQTYRWLPQAIQDHENVIRCSRTLVKTWERPLPSAAKNLSYYYKMMEWRNEWMLEDSSVSIICWNGKKKGGTYNYLSCARTGKSKIPGAMFNNLKKEHIYHINPVTKTSGWIRNAN